MHVMRGVERLKLGRGHMVRDRRHVSPRLLFGRDATPAAPETPYCAAAKMLIEFGHMDAHSTNVQREICHDKNTHHDDRRRGPRHCRHGRRGARLQLVRLHRRGSADQVRGRDRDRAGLRCLRFQRVAGNQDAGRRIGIRCRRAHRHLPAAPDPGGRLPEARLRQAAQCRASLGRHPRADREIRPRPRVFGQLHVGHDRHRRQRQQGRGSAGRGRAHRQPRADLRSREHGEAAGMRRAPSGRPDRDDPGRPDLSGRGSRQQGSRKDRAGRRGAGEGPPLRAEIPQLGIHQRAGQRRHLRGLRLVG